MFKRDLETNKILLDNHSTPNFLRAVKKNMAVHNRGGNFISLEDLHPNSVTSILSSSRRGYEYLKILKKHLKVDKLERVPLYEQTLVKNNSQKFFYFYTKDIIKRRIEDLEPLLFSREGGVITLRGASYIKNVVKSRPLDYEPVILQSSKKVRDHYIKFLEELRSNS